ncbi:MAG: choice-of-anchor tandem repeat GloVer-containing protein [Verrucomicrobiota bacterium]
MKIEKTCQNDLINKKGIKFLLFLAAFIVGPGLLLSSRATAQGFTTLHSFAGISDGANPRTGLILSGNILYGTAYNGGSSGQGTVFAVNTDGTGFTNLYNFTGRSDGANPSADLILSGNTLYGTAVNGGSSQEGTVFAINTDGTGFRRLHDFTAVVWDGDGSSNNDGGIPLAPLMLSGNTLYGTAQDGGLNGVGTLFALNTSGASFTTLYNFGGPGVAPVAPHGGLALSGNTLYGTTIYGGSNDSGTVFAVNTNGSGVTNLYSFPGGSDGTSPCAGVILSGNTLYGTAIGGGTSGEGTVFAVNTNGTDFTVLHSFTGGADGGGPFCSLILSGNILYGTAQSGGIWNHGTVFAVNTDGTGFATLYNFTGGNDGAEPAADLILSGNTLYGTTVYGGSSSNGTVFSIELGEFIDTTNSGAITITGYTGFSNELDIPSQINGLPVTRIGSGAFGGDDRLTGVTISDSVTNVGAGAFVGCSSLTAIAVDTRNPYYSDVDGVLFNGNLTTLVEYPAGIAGNYTVPDGVSSVGNAAFEDCFGLTNITIPDTVTNIGENAFTDCPNLRSVYFEGNGPFFGPSSFGNPIPIIGRFGVTPPNLDPATLYYLPETTGWNIVGYTLEGGEPISSPAGLPTLPWLPQVQTGDDSFGMRNHQFGFNLAWVGGKTVVVEACTNLANPAWVPVWTNTLTTGSTYFSDPQWTNYPGRFYRVISP